VTRSIPLPTNGAAIIVELCMLAEALCGPAAMMTTQAQIKAKAVRNIASSPIPKTGPTNSSGSRNQQ
jgi:hypothetical protein